MSAANRGSRMPARSLHDRVQIGNRTASNRIALAPMTNKQSHDTGELSEAEITWLAMRARGGFGLVITGAWAVTPEGRVWHGQTALYGPQHAPPLARLGAAIAQTSALGIVQLIHGGNRATPSITKTEGISASAGQAWRAATEEDIERLIAAHVTAARRAEEAGLAGVEIHAAHGFLPAQFLSRTANIRNDRWGGDLTGRSRFLRELVRAVRAATGDDFIVGVRLSPEDERHGIFLAETADVGAALAHDGVDYLHLSLGDALARSSSDPAHHPLDMVRAAVPSHVAIVAAGSMWTPAQAALVVELGADLVALGLAGIVNPDWPMQARDPHWSPVRPPRSADQLAAAGVTAPFLAYLREDWPDFVRQGTSPSR